MLIYQLSASAPRKMLNPVALHMDHIIWYTVRLGCKPSQNEKHIFGIGRKTSPDAHWNLDFSWKFLANLNRTF